MQTFLFSALLLLMTGMDPALVKITAQVETKEVTVRVPDLKTKQQYAVIPVTSKGYPLVSKAGSRLTIVLIDAEGKVKEFTYDMGLDIILRVSQNTAGP